MTKPGAERRGKGWRRVHIQEREWVYRVGRRGGGVVIHGPDGQRIATHAADIKGQWPSDFERGQWKRTSDGMLKPRHVKLFIEVGLSLGAPEPVSTERAVSRLVVTRVNRVAQLCRDPEAIARNAEAVRRAARQWIDDGSERSLRKVGSR